MISPPKGGPSHDAWISDDESPYTPIAWERPAIEWRHLIGSPYCDLTPTQKHVLTTMCRWSGRYADNIYPSQRSIATRAGVCLRTVNQTMQRAEREGWIVRRMLPGRYERTQYELTIPSGLYYVTQFLPQRWWLPPKGGYRYLMERHDDEVVLVEIDPTSCN